MARIEFIDTTLRDGQQSLWALGMRTGVMLPALESLDGAGFEAMEFFVPVVQMKKMIRDLGENPFHWLSMGAKRAVQTPLRLHAGYRSGLGKVPESVGKLLVERVIDNGITVARISDPWNDFDTLREEHDTLRAMGMESVVNLIYSVSPRHTDAYFLDRVARAVELRPYRLCFKDVGGLLTPERAAELVPRILQAAGDIPVEFHCHCNNGLAPYNVTRVAELGIRHIHTAVPPLANGSSQPSVFSAAANLRAIGFEVGVDERPLRDVERFLQRIARRDGLPEGAPLEYDAGLYRHQVPGGMISNLRYQLDKMGMGHRIDEVIDEAAAVRADLGYPIMVTPLSQFVGTQAAINVIVGERYRQVTDEIIQYSMGHWGREALDHMDANVADRIQDRPRARELALADYPEPDLKALRHRYGEGLSDEELILRVYVDEDAVALARATPPPKEEALAGSSLVDLVARLSRVEGRELISLRKGDMKLTLHGGGGNRAPGG